MTMKRFKVMKAKFGGSELYGGGRIKAGEWMVFFPRSSYDSVSTDGKKKFSNVYVRLNDLHLYPEFAEIRQKIIDDYKIDPDTYGKLKTTWRH